ncbi:hypothetical protein BST91_03985 [Nonlabens tegetincola]|nr:hypothetical protein BST91_03985 [Nonlabens tegetincola]
MGYLIYAIFTPREIKSINPIRLKHNKWVYRFIILLFFYSFITQVILVFQILDYGRQDYLFSRVHFGTGKGFLTLSAQLMLVVSFVSFTLIKRDSHYRKKYIVIFLSSVLIGLSYYVFVQYRNALFVLFIFYFLLNHPFKF